MLLRTVTHQVQSIRQWYGRISPRTRLQAAIVLGVVGLLVFGIGIYNTIDVTNKYNDLDAIPEPDPQTLKDMSQGELMTVAQVGIAKRDLLARRSQASSVIGAGAAVLGVAVLIFVSLPEQQPRPKTPGNPAPSRSATSEPPGAAEAAADDNPDEDGAVKN